MAKKPTKTCRRCKQSLPRTDFYACKQTKDGLGSYCRTCARELARKPAPEVIDLPGEV